MEGLTLNKYLGAGLATALLIVFMASVIPPFFQPSPPAHPGYAIAVSPELLGPSSAAAAPEVPPDWGTVLPTADVAAGQAKTVVCQSCHDFDPAGTNKIGPGLYGVLGRKPGTHPGFAYSSAMQAFGAKNPVWTYDLVFQFIKGPQAFVPGTKMTFTGLPSAQDRINVIAYLHTLGSTLPIPKPKPPAPKAAPAPGGPPGSPPAKAGGATPAPPGAPAASKPGTPAPSSSQTKPGQPKVG